MKQKNVNRLAQFCQFRKEIRGSKEYLIVGIDVAKDRHHAFFGMATGKTLLKRLVFDNNIDGFQKLLTYVDAIKVREGLSEVVFGLEPTANYHKPLGEFLIKADQIVVLISTNAAKRNRETLDGRWDKNDTKDSANVADMISQGKCLYYEYASEQLRDLRSLLSLRRKLKKMEHALRMRIRNHLLAQYFPEMDEYFPGGDNDCLSIIKSFLNPSLIAGTDYEKFCRIAPSRGKTISQQRRLSAIWQQAHNSIGCDIGEAGEFEAATLVESLEAIRRDISKVNGKIQETCCQFSEYEYLMSIPGYGPTISAMVLAAIGDPFRFSNGSQLLKLVGLDLTAQRSGKKSTNVTTSISKKGKSEVRYALYHAALVASSRDKHFMRYFTDKIRNRAKEKGIKTKMRVKLSAKMLQIAWALMKKKEYFDPKHLNSDAS